MSPRTVDAPHNVRGLVSIVIVTWNSASTLSACLASLREQIYPALELIVVDNASEDDSLAVTKRSFPGAIIMANDVNTGFCAGQNAGINEARGEYVLPLNPDVRLSPDFISNLVQVMQQDRSIGTVTGKLYLEGSDPKTSAQLLDSTGMFIERTRRQYLRGHGTPDLGQFDTGGFVFGACGAAPLLRREMLTDTRVDGDYFDRDFFAHKEDVDLAWRAQLLGWKAWYEPAATAYHDRTFRPGSGRRKAISSTIKGAAVRNRYFTILKNDLPQNVIRDMPKILSYDVAILIYLIIFERSSLVGVKQAIQALPRMSAKRRMIMRRRRVSSRYMRQVMEPAP